MARNLRSCVAATEGVAKLSVAPLWERLQPQMTPQVIDFWQSIRG